MLGDETAHQTLPGRSQCLLLHEGLINTGGLVAKSNWKHR